MKDKIPTVVLASGHTWDLVTAHDKSSYHRGCLQNVSLHHKCRALPFTYGSVVEWVNSQGRCSRGALPTYISPQHVIWYNSVGKLDREGAPAVIWIPRTFCHS